MISIKNQTKLLWIISSLLLFPLFFQISGGVYNDFVAVVDSGGVLTKLPLPISILACLGGILLFRDKFRRGYLAVALITSMFLVMVISIMFAGIGLEIEKSKIILLLQVMLPTFALLLGQMVIDTDKIIAKAFLYVLCLVVPFQLMATYLAGSLTLTHNLYIFSIYQHFQYVTLIFVSAFAYSMSNLWGSHKRILIALIPLMLFYSTASISFLTIFSFITFISFFAYSKLSIRFKKPLSAVVTLAGAIILIIFMQAYFGLAKNHTSIGIMKQGSTVVNVDGGQYVGKIETLSKGKVPANVVERFEIWKLYISRISESEKTLVFGHDVPLAREVKTSAHNWYIDMIYNFGLISVLPILMLIFYTVFLCWKSRANMPSETVWLIAIVFYLAVIDNNFKVTFRQPYPGIFSFFLWGLLLSRLQFLATEHKKPALNLPGNFN